MTGIDISKWQGNIDYSLAALDDKVNFVIIKCGGGDENSLYEDPKFREYYKGFKEKGLPIGTYFFGGARTTERASLEADKCLQIIREYDFDLPVFYDVEAEMIDPPQNISLLSEIIDVFLTKISAAGYRAGIYASSSVFNNNINEEIKTKYDLWVAHWSSNPPKIDDMKIWQSGTTLINGISGEVDYNTLYDNELIGKKRYYYCHPLGLNAPHAVITSYDNHKALDISLKTDGTNKSTLGTPIYSMTDGVVTYATYPLNSYEYSDIQTGGNYVTIKASNTGIQSKGLYKDNFYIDYMHLVNPDEYPNFRKFAPGETIRKGQIIGGMGASGRTSGSEGLFVHLHLQMRDDNYNELTVTDRTLINDYESYENKKINNPSGIPTYPVIENSIFKYDRAIFSNIPQRVNIYTEDYEEESPTDISVPSKDILSKSHYLTEEYVTATIRRQFVGDYPKSIAEIQAPEYKGLFLLTNICLREFGGFELTIGLYAKLLRTWYFYYDSYYTKSCSNKFHQNPDIKTFAKFFQEMRVIWVGSDAGDLNSKVPGVTDEQYLNYMEIVYKNFRYGGTYKIDNSREENVICALSSVSSNAYPMPSSGLAYSWRKDGTSYNYVLYRLQNGDNCIKSNLYKIYNENAAYKGKQWNEIILEEESYAN